MTGGETDRLRRRIDAGGERDKVAFPDPAAAPLGTDDEAAGVERPPSPTSAATVPAEHRAPADTGEASRSISGEMRRPLRLGLAVAVAAAAVLLALAIAFARA